MGFRFRRSFRVLPGVRLNLSRFGVSTSVGTRGASFTIGTRGARATVGIPGSGLSYTETMSATRSAPEASNALPEPLATTSEEGAAPEEREPFTISLSAMILALAAVVLLIAAGIALFH